MKKSLLLLFCCCLYSAAPTSSSSSSDLSSTGGASAAVDRSAQEVLTKHAKYEADLNAAITDQATINKCCADLATWSGAKYKAKTHSVTKLTKDKKGLWPKSGDIPKLLGGDGGKVTKGGYGQYFDHYSSNLDKVNAVARCCGMKEVAKHNRLNTKDLPDTRDAFEHLRIAMEDALVRAAEIAKAMDTKVQGLEAQAPEAVDREALKDAVRRKKHKERTEKQEEVRVERERAERLMAQECADIESLMEAIRGQDTDATLDELQRFVTKYNGGDGGMSFPMLKTVCNSILTWETENHELQSTFSANFSQVNFLSMVSKEVLQLFAEELRVFKNACDKIKSTEHASRGVIRDITQWCVSCCGSELEGLYPVCFIGNPSQVETYHMSGCLQRLDLRVNDDQARECINKAVVQLLSLFYNLEAFDDVYSTIASCLFNLRQHKIVKEELRAVASIGRVESRFEFLWHLYDALVKIDADASGDNGDVFLLALMQTLLDGYDENLKAGFVASLAAQSDATVAQGRWYKDATEIFKLRVKGNHLNIQCTPTAVILSCGDSGAGESAAFDDAVLRQLYQFINTKGCYSACVNTSK